MPVATATGLLEGTTVLDLSTVGPAARCARALADYGARVVKVGPLAGRGHEPIRPAAWAYSGHRHMARVEVDLRRPEGTEAFLALAAAADVVLESFRPGVMDRLGVGYAAVAARNPGIVYCSTSGYGQDGPRAGWAGHDVDYLAAGGYLASTGRRADGGPPLPGATIADAAAGGLHAALAIAAALVARARTGTGTHLDVAVADGVLWLMALQLDEHLATGSEPGPGHDVLTGRYACYDVYRTADGGWLAVGAIEAKFFANLCRSLGVEHWTGHQYDDAVQDQIRAELAACFARRPRDEWVAELAGADTCVAPVLSVAEVAADPALAARGALTEAVTAAGERVRQVGPLLAGTVPAAGPVALPDPDRTDTGDLLAEAGVDGAVAAGWRAAGVVR